VSLGLGCEFALAAEWPNRRRSKTNAAGSSHSSRIYALATRLVEMAVWPSSTASAGAMTISPMTMSSTRAASRGPSDL
jgi:hypothetical protein